MRCRYKERIIISPCSHPLDLCPIVSERIDFPPRHSRHHHWLALPGIVATTTLIELIGRKNIGLDEKSPEQSPRGFPDRSNTTERTIASSSPDSKGASWNISKISSSVTESICHRATVRPGRMAAISCDKSINPHKRYLSGSKYAHDQRWTLAPSSK